MHVPARLRRLVAALLTSLVAAGLLAPAPAFAGTAPSYGERVRTLSAAYRGAAGWKYSQRLQDELRAVRHLAPAGCIAQQRELIRIGAALGFDGLESLALAQHDCLTRATTADDRKAAVAVSAELARSLRFATAPVRNLPQRFARRDTLVERGVETAALRVVLGALAESSAATAATTSTETLLESASVQRRLCQLPLRVGPDGRPSGTSLVRIATCEALGTPGGRGVVEELCGAGEPGSEPFARIGSKGAASVPSGASDQTRRDAYEVAASTCAGVTMPGAGLTGIDALDPFSIESCLGGTPQDQAGAVDVARLVVECFGTGTESGGWDPAADGGGEDPPKTASTDGGTTSASTDDTATEKDSATESDGSKDAGDSGVTADDVVGAVGDAASTTEAAAVAAEAVALAANVAVPAIEVAGTYAGIVGMVINLYAMGKETLTAMIDTQKAMESDGWCMANCFQEESLEDGGDPEVGPAGSFDPNNPACQQLSEMGLLPQNGEFDPNELAPHAIVQPSPEAEEIAATSAGTCGADTGASLDASVACRVDKDCGPFADLGADCSCRPRTDALSAIKSMSCSAIQRCGEGQRVVQAAGQCYCASAGDDALPDRWGQPGEPDPVSGGSR